MKKEIEKYVAIIRLTVGIPLALVSVILMVVQKVFLAFVVLFAVVLLLILLRIAMDTEISRWRLKRKKLKKDREDGED